MKSLSIFASAILALILINACDDSNATSSGDNSEKTIVDRRSKKDEPAAPWIELKAGICKIEQSHKNASSFELSCPSPVTWLHWGGLSSGGFIELDVGNYNGQGPALVHIKKSPDGRSVTGRIRGKNIVITLDLKDGRREILTIRNEETPQSELKLEFDRTAGELTNKFNALEPKHRLTFDTFVYDGEVLVTDDESHAHGLGRVTDNSGRTLITHFYGLHAAPSEGFLRNPSSGLECAGIFADFKMKDVICLQGGKYIRAGSDHDE